MEPYRGDQHSHGMRVIAEGLQVLGHVLMDKGVTHDASCPNVELFLGGQLAVDQEVRDLQEARVLRQVLNVVASVAENALVAIDVRDGGPTDSRIQVAVVIHRETQLLEGTGRDRVLENGDLKSLVGASVSDSQSVVIFHE